jgi:hypothetical protein
MCNKSQGKLTLFDHLPPEGRRGERLAANPTVPDLLDVQSHRKELGILASKALNRKLYYRLALSSCAALPLLFGPFASNEGCEDSKTGKIKC